MVKRTSPFFTASPVFTFTSFIVPSTSGLTAELLAARNEPLASTFGA